MPAAARHLVFMTYLNDVTDAGGTEFLLSGDYRAAPGRAHADLAG
jgi:hypothetical protein